MDKEVYLKLLRKARKETPVLVSSRGERFKVPVLIGYIEGSKTIIQNFSEACKAINREEEHVLHFLGRELGTAYSKKGAAAHLQGRFLMSKVNKKFVKYVNLYVICPVCKRPDTRIIKEKKIQQLKCEACGALSPVKKA